MHEADNGDEAGKKLQQRCDNLPEHLQVRKEFDEK
jgi:hypothetical protein